MLVVAVVHAEDQGIGEVEATVVSFFERLILGISANGLEQWISDLEDDEWSRRRCPQNYRQFVESLDTDVSVSQLEQGKDHVSGRRTLTGHFQLPPG